MTTERAFHPFALGLTATATLFLAVIVGCGDDDGSPTTTGGSVTITAPAPVTPQGGSEVSARPTLTVSNVTVSDGSTPTYTFQVASDSGFATVVAQTSGISEGEGGETSWRVEEALDRGTEYFWRARASAGGASGPFSTTRSFSVRAQGRGGAREIIFDPLTTGGSSAARTVSGGTFTPEGWEVTSRFDFIRYDVNPIRSGFVEWNNKGMMPENPSILQFMLFGMWDPTEGAYRDNPFRVHLQKLHPPQHNPPFIRMRWISQGDVFEDGRNFTDWDPEVTYTWRIEWGPVGEDSFFAMVFLDGREIITVEYDLPYALEQHFIEMGIAARDESIVGVVYSNVSINEK